MNRGAAIVGAVFTMRVGSRGAGALIPALVCASLIGCRGPEPRQGPVARPAESPNPSEAAIFHDRAAESGVDFVHFNGMSGELYFCEMMGAGAALLDADGDGDLDLYLVQGTWLGSDRETPRGSMPPRDRVPTDTLYLNQLAETGTLEFVDVTDASGIAVEDYGMGVAAGDFDNDGDPDLYVTNFGRNRMLENLGAGAEGSVTFRDVTERTGTGDERWSTSAAFLDYDRDGWLDLYVTNYVDFNLSTHKACYSETSARDYCGPLSYRAFPDRLYRNRGDGTFEDATVEARIFTEYGGALGVVTGDFNGDGRVDAYVANDASANQLWINQGAGADGTVFFRDDALLAGCAYNEEGKAEGSMGVDAADFDGDGDQDLFMTHIVGETNTLYLNDGAGMFVDYTRPSGLGIASRPYTGFGAGFFDYDNDGWLDLLVVNGAVKTIEAQARAGDPYPLHQINQLFRNTGGAGSAGSAGAFEEVTSKAGAVFQLSEVSRGAAFGDLDNDGDTDVLITNNNGPARLLINSAGQNRSWLGLRLVDRHGRDAYGARAGIELMDGRVLWRRVRADGSYGSANDPRLLFGLAEARSVRSLRVRWPDGSGEQWDGSSLALDRYQTLAQGSGAAGSDR